MGERRVLELWLCPECGDHSHFDRWKPEPPACLSHIPPVRMVRVRALVLDDAAIEHTARALHDGYAEHTAPAWEAETARTREACRVTARAVLGLPHPQEPRP